MPVWPLKEIYIALWPLKEIYIALWPLKEINIALWPFKLVQGGHCGNQGRVRKNEKG